MKTRREFLCHTPAIPLTIVGAAGLTERPSSEVDIAKQDSHDEMPWLSVRYFVSTRDGILTARCHFSGYDGLAFLAAGARWREADGLWARLRRIENPINGGRTLNRPSIFLRDLGALASPETLAKGRRASSDGRPPRCFAGADHDPSLVDVGDVGLASKWQFLYFALRCMECDIDLHGHSIPEEGTPGPFLSRSEYNTYERLMVDVTQWMQGIVWPHKIEA